MRRRSPSRRSGRGTPGCSRHRISSAPSRHRSLTPRSGPPRSPRSRTTSAMSPPSPSCGSGRRTQRAPGAGLGSLLQQPGHLLLRAGAAFPVGTGAGAEAVRVPLGYQPAPGRAGLCAGQHCQPRQHRGLLGRQVPLLDGAAGHVRPGDHHGAADLPDPRLPLRACHGAGGHGPGAELPLPAGRALLPVAGGGERRLPGLGRHPLPQRLRCRAPARPRCRRRRHRVGGEPTARTESGAGT